MKCEPTVSSQYRNPLNFTEQAVKAARKALKRLDKVRAQLIETLAKEDIIEGKESEISLTLVPKQMKNFESALLDDLSMPRAAASLFALIKAAEGEFKKADDLDMAGLQAINGALSEMDKVFGVFYQVPLSDVEEQEQKDALVVPKQVLELVEQRTLAKDAKDWDLADSLRQRITELGFKVKDVKGGDPIVSRLES